MSIQYPGLPGITGCHIGITLAQRLAKCRGMLRPELLKVLPAGQPASQQQQPT